MYSSHNITVVIPTFNEELFIAKTISSIPDFVDFIIVVDDASKDSSLEVISAAQSSKLIVIKHQKNLGVGAATISGYRQALLLATDIVVVMDGDGQMDAKDLPKLLDQVITLKHHYVKGNRFLDSSIKTMPKFRYLGNKIFSNLMRYALGLPFIIDTQCGYTAITIEAIKQLDLDRLYPRYGFLNSLLFQLVARNLRISTVAVRTVYGEEKSDINPFITVPTILYIILYGYLSRIFGNFLTKPTLIAINYNQTNK